MARFALSIMVLMLLVYIMPESAIARHSNPTDFIKTSCAATRYPALCVQSLLGYASVIGQSDHQLAITALSVSISRTRSCASFVKNMTKVKEMKTRDYRAVQDCLENMGNSVDHLSKSARELNRTGGAVGRDFLWRMSNVQTWVSAALTDQNTCLDGFTASQINRNVKAVVSSRAVDVAQVTSNALALVNRFASRQKAAQSTETPSS